MCVDCVLASPRIAQVDPDDGPPFEVVLSQRSGLTLTKIILYHHKNFRERHHCSIQKGKEMIRTG
jgi:hypothetical protein